jgi:DNA-binding beta-propeller fold protein YncE
LFRLATAGNSLSGGTIVMIRANGSLRWIVLPAVILALVFFSQNHLRLLAAKPNEYRPLARLTLGGEGFWDYLAIDSVARRLYVTRWTHVMVIDADSYKVVGDIPGIHGAHGISIAREFNRGFITEDEANQITIFDLRTLKTIATAKTGKGPDGIVYDPASRRVFAFSHDGTTTAVDAATGAVVGTIELDGQPEFAAADGQGYVYNNIENKSEVLQIDSHTLKVLNRWPLGPGESPSGMAIDRQHRRLFVGCRNQTLVAMDAETGKVVATEPIGEGVDANRFDPSTQLVFSSNGDGTLGIVHEDSPDTYTVVTNIRTQRGARTMELDPKTHRIYLVTAKLGPQPQPTADDPHPAPPMVPGTFTLLVYGQGEPK